MEEKVIAVIIIGALFVCLVIVTLSIYLCWSYMCTKQPSAHKGYVNSVSSVSHQRHSVRDNTNNDGDVTNDFQNTLQIISPERRESTTSSLQRLSSTEAVSPETANPLPPQDWPPPPPPPVIPI